MGNLVAQSMVTAFAHAGQYLVPLVGLIGAAISFFSAQAANRFGHGRGASPKRKCA